MLSLRRLLDCDSSAAVSCESLDFAFAGLSRERPRFRLLLVPGSARTLFRACSMSLIMGVANPKLVKLPSRETNETPIPSTKTPFGIPIE